MKRVFHTLVVAIPIGIAAPLAAQAANHNTGHGAEAKVAQASASLADGEVRKVDVETKKITIRHGPIQNLDMPAMTMVFQVKDPALLGQLKSGDKIRFSADKVGGVYTVTHIEPTK